ncbi:MAG: ABC transporter ATP-binding protein [Candidatus Lokiarchaeota archaeon]|nr:ABC transporter ATP-binding protein [Candidatus Lokiarchaeota archaeon]
MPETTLPEHRASFRELVGILRPHWKRSVASIFLSIVQVSLHIQFPVILQTMVSKVIAGDSAELALTFAWLIAVFGAEGVVIFVRLNLNQRVANDIVYETRNKVLGKVLRHSYRFLDTEQSGDLVSTITSDVNLIKHFLAFHIPYFTRNVVQLVGLVAIMYFISPNLLLSLLPILPFLAAAMVVYFRKIRPITFKQREIFGDLTSRLQENISGIQLVRSFANEGVEVGQFDEVNVAFRNTSRRTSKMASAYNPIIHFLIRLGWTTVLGFGGYLILSGATGITMSLDQLFAFIPSLNLIVEPIQFITWWGGEMGRILAAYERIKRVLDINVDVEQRPGAVKLPRLKGDVTFKDVTFEYERDNPVIAGINIHVPAGKTVALLGATGSGKSTVMHLLGRFYDVTSGAIILDDRWDLRDVDLDSYRDQIGVVAQEPFLFQQSILENVTHGLEPARWTMEAVIDACRIANIHGFIDSLPEKYDTIVGERGTTVSGGQKQRLTLARAILRQPRIFILDDSTSSVDVDTEYEILSDLKRVFSTCTTFIITQRLSTVRNADYIYMLDKGRVAEEGTHQQLMARDGIYATLYNTITYSPANDPRWKRGA